MKVKYKGETTIPLALAIGISPAVTKGQIYEVIVDNKDSDMYVILDDYNMTKVIRKELFEIVEDKGE